MSERSLEVPNIDYVQVVVGDRKIIQLVLKFVTPRWLGHLEIFLQPLAECIIVAKTTAGKLCADQISDC